MVSEKCFIFLETFPETRHHLEAENEELKASMKILEQRCAELTEINKKKQQDWVQSTNTKNLGPTEEENLGQTAMEKNLGQVEEKNLGLTAIEKNLEETAEDSTEDVQVVRLRAEVSALSAEAKVLRSDLTTAGRQLAEKEQQLASCQAQLQQLLAEKEQDLADFLKVKRSVPVPVLMLSSEINQCSVRYITVNSS